jgi:hypothetical protein
MSQGALLIELIKYVGFPAVIFAIWYLYHQSQVRLWSENSKSNSEVFERILRERSIRDARDYELMKNQIEVAQMQAAILARLEQKIDTNQFCPMVKEGYRK